MAEVALTYEELRKQRCKWCAKGIPLVNRMVTCYHRFEYIQDDSCDMECTAPTLEAAYSELSERVAELETEHELLRVALETIADDSSTEGYLRDIRGGNAAIAQQVIVDINAARAKETK